MSQTHDTVARQAGGFLSFLTGPYGAVIVGLLVTAGIAYEGYVIYKASLRWRAERDARRAEASVPTASRPSGERMLVRTRTDWR